MMNDESFSNRHTYHLAEFTRFHDRVFIDTACAGVLKREPDPKLAQDYLQQLREGQLSKIEILGRLRFSTEGRRQGVQVQGLFWPFVVLSLGKLPILGYPFRFLTALARLPRLFRNLQILENSVSQRLTHLETRAAWIEPQLAELQQAFARNVGTDYPEAIYLALENAFRGTAQDLEARLQIYIPLIAEVASLEGLVLDLGCGRGEWLGVLHRQGIPAQGVDQSQMMVSKCQHLGYDAVQADALAYLQSLEDNSRPAITAIQLMEHLPPSVLVQVWQEAYRVLKPGGLVLFETPNPENVQMAAYSFYLDPTHRHPIPPPLATYTLDAIGFQNIKVIRNREFERPIFEDSRLNGFFCSAMDYAVVGYKERGVRSEERGVRSEE